MATAVPAREAGRTGRTTGIKKDKTGRELKLHIGTKNHTTSDQFEDSGIGLDDSMSHTDASLKVLATPPSGKRKVQNTSPKTPRSAPPSSGTVSGSGSISDSFASMTFTSDHSTVRQQSQQSRSIHIVQGSGGGGSRGQSHTTNSPEVFSKSASPPHHTSSGIFSILKETVSRTVSSSSSSSFSGSTSKSSEKPSFQIGSDSEEEASSGSGRSSRRSSQKSSGVREGRHESKGKGRFKRILNPLRRSHSAGCDQDVPAHALFLKHEAEKKKMSSSQHSSPGFDTGRPGSDSEGEEGDRKSGKSKKKSLARDLKDKMAFLRRRHTDTALSSKVSDSKSDRPSPEAVVSWTKEFENLLYDKVGLSMFRDFLQSEFSDENLEFWIACEEYKNLKDAKLTAQAQKIYTDFVAVQAPREINLDSKTRMACRNNMANPNKQTFEQSQKRIQGLMEKDSYPRFLKSETFQELCTELKLNIHS